MQKVLIALSCMIVLTIILTIFYEQSREPVPLPYYNIEQNQQQEESNTPEEKESLVPIKGNEEDTIGYSLQNDELQMTNYDGNTWTTVPVEKDLLFQGEYQGGETELIENSFILTEDNAAFLYSEGGIKVIYSQNQGETWEKSIVDNGIPVIRFRKIEFMDDQFWYVILSNNRTMSQERSLIYISTNQGESWKSINMPDTTRLVADGGFVDEETGFMSYGTINPEAPDLYVTNNQGETWEQAVFNMPSQYDRVFVIARAPYKEEDHLALIMDQGPNGDYYQDGLIRAKFISTDNGRTWEFAEEVVPENEEMG
ncbi:WD40/YVTN/BNR-like repeat-containing protein [Gracilibacillus lacisalsi]|uniref:WD40/YVTN/BNR-like repeat-containing protein n=1 Tax=Gracilibacillus lacisalsi TaxID=393087 RepID=UPI000375ABF0|nr:sialidase family protein [Gracilibacillus lacisalsi]